MRSFLEIDIGIKMSKGMIWHNQQFVFASEGIISVEQIPDRYFYGI